jgi:hypothetical protein
MPFSLRPFRRFPLQCSVTYMVGLFLKPRATAHFPNL